MLGGPENISCDVLVIGGGGAGLRAAIEARKMGVSVILASKSQVGLGNNTALSKATIAAPTLGDKSDGYQSHLQDTLQSGRYINDERLARKISEEIAGEVSLLESFGIYFQKNGKGLITEKVPGHSYARHVLGKTRQGTNFTLPLKDYASRIGVRFIEKVFISKLLRGKRGIAAVGVDMSGRFCVFQSKSTVIATGGFGQMYLYTNNAVGATGDGLALAFNMGIPLRDMEFIQFYPTAISGIRFLSYEIFVCLHNATLKNKLAEDVIKKHGLDDPLVMTQDRLTRAIMKEILDGLDINSGVIMDLKSIPEADLLRRRTFLPEATFGKPGKREYTVSPTSHFTMGGIVTDENAATSIPGLFACGEVCGGAHGANRLAGNALSEVFVMGRIAGQHAALAALESPAEKPDPSEVSAEMNRLESLFGWQDINLSAIRHLLKESMWYNGGILRNKTSLEKALKTISETKLLSQKAGVDNIKDLKARLELDNLLLLSEMVIEAALKRQESRGSHYREDYPGENPDWCKGIFISNRNGRITLETKTA